MRYSSALVLSTIAVGQAAAAHHHNRHASFHARRQADTKRSAAQDVNWKAVAYDLNDVDWDNVNWNSVFASPTPTPTPTSTPAAQATPSAVAEEKTSEKPAPTSSAEEAVKVQEVETSAAPSSTKAAATSSAPAATSSDASYDLGDLIEDVGNLLQGVEGFVKSLGIVSTGKNDKSNNGAMWVGNDGKWKAEFANVADEDAVIFCWKADGFSGMSLNVNQPEISVGLKAGEKTIVSFADSVPSACAPAYKSTKLANFGGLDQTWWEVTFGEYGAFDVSRNVNMKGAHIKSTGSKCTSAMEECVFKCLKDANGNEPDSCEKGYDLFNCTAANGGGGGYDPIMDGTGGGCAMDSAGETIKVLFSTSPIPDDA